MPFETIVVLDFEATCQEGGAPTPQEVIEFPSVLVSLRTGAVVDVFTSFVRPVHHPQLSPFCTELTSITQAEVDAAAPFLEVLANHKAWLASHGLTAESAALVTCGDWDLATMLPGQCAASGLAISALPAIYRRWVNIKKVFVDTVHKAKAFGMPAMLRSLDLALEGRHHRGIDDCHNIARIALALAGRGAKFEVTGRMSGSLYPPLEVELCWGTQVQRVTLRKRLVPTVLGLASGVFRSQMVAVHGQDGAPMTDDALTELGEGAMLRVTAARDVA